MTHEWQVRFCRGSSRVVAAAHHVCGAPGVSFGGGLSRVRLDPELTEIVSMAAMAAGGTGREKQRDFGHIGLDHDGLGG